MTKKFSMSDLEPMILEVLSKGGTFTFIPRGTSMLPLIREGLDSVILSPLCEKIYPGDIILYKRDNGQFVLHRVMKVKKDSFTMCGDNQVVFEHGIRRHNMIAVVTGILRDGEEITFSENKEYFSYMKNILSEKKRKNFIYRLKHITKKYVLRITK